MERARSLLEQALKLGREDESLDLQTFALMNLAILELELKDSAAAVKHAREAVALEGTLERQSLSHFTLGRALREQGDLTAAQAKSSKRPSASPGSAETGGEKPVSTWSWRG